MEIDLSTLLMRNGMDLTGLGRGAQVPSDNTSLSRRKAYNKTRYGVVVAGGDTEKDDVVRRLQGAFRRNVHPARKDLASDKGIAERLVRNHAHTSDLSADKRNLTKEILNQMEQLRLKERRANQNIYLSRETGNTSFDTEIKTEKAKLARFKKEREDLPSKYLKFMKSKDEDGIRAYREERTKRQDLEKAYEETLETQKKAKALILKEKDETARKDKYATYRSEYPIKESRYGLRDDA